MFQIPFSRILQINTESRQLSDWSLASFSSWAKREDLHNRSVEHPSNHHFSAKDFRPQVCSKVLREGVPGSLLCGSKTSFSRLAKKIPQHFLTKARIFLITKRNTKHFTPTILLPQCGVGNMTAKYCLVLQDQQTKTKQSRLS